MILWYRLAQWIPRMVQNGFTHMAGGWLHLTRGWSGLVSLILGLVDMVVLRDAEPQYQSIFQTFIYTSFGNVSLAKGTHVAKTRVRCEGITQRYGFGVSSASFHFCKKPDHKRLFSLFYLSPCLSNQPSWFATVFLRVNMYSCFSVEDGMEKREDLGWGLQ